LRLVFDPDREVQAGSKERARVYCSRCGHPNKEGVRHCAGCGAPLQEETTLGLTPVEVEEEVGDDFPFPDEHLELGQGLLMVKHGPNAGSTFMLEAEVTTVGRNPESDVFLDDVTVSRRHAELRRRDGAFSIHDVGSLNGTYVNGERVDATQLASGDEVQIGKFKLVFFQGE
jgi:pSer/pThr/pTyr-binding forkhead associated (FHA) protein